ncbi:MAG: hypothetical protein ACF8SC_07565 [Phycisphaerales bacterium JB037]
MFRFSRLALVVASLGCASVAVGQQSWWYFTNSDGLHRLEADGSSGQWLTPQDPPEFSSADIAVDPISSRVYANSPAFGQIYYSDLDGQGIVQYSSTSVRRIETDAVGQLFATRTRRILKIVQNGSEPAVDPATSNPQGIAIDDLNGFIYWTNEGDTDSIYRARKNGSGLELVLGGLGASAASNIVDLTLTPDGTRMFWTGGIDGFGTGGIWTAATDGSGATQLVAGLSSPARGLAFNPLDQKLYWGDFFTAQVMRMNSDGTDLEVFFDASVFGPRISDLALYIVPVPGSAVLLSGCFGMLGVRRRRPM